MRRTQLYLDDDLWERLHAAARSSGTTISDLVRKAVREKYGVDSERRQRAFEAVIGIWADRKDLGDTEAYVRQLRRDTRWKRVEKLLR